MIRVAAIDLDHTLLSSDWTIRDVDREAVIRAANSGIAIILATGRMPSAALKAAQSILAYVDYIVSYNGALTLKMPSELQLSSRSVDLQLAREVFRDAIVRGYTLVLFSGDDVYTTSCDVANDPVLTCYSQRTSAIIQPIGDLENFHSRELHKFFAYDPRILNSYDPRVESPFEHQVYVELSSGPMVGVRALKTRLGYVEFISEQVSKMAAINDILLELSLSVGNLMAIGDAYNDFEMVGTAHLGFAVANAIPELHRVADYVVASNDGGGVAEAIDIVLRNRDLDKMA